MICPTHIISFLLTSPILDLPDCKQREFHSEASSEKCLEGCI